MGRLTKKVLASRQRLLRKNVGLQPSTATVQQDIMCWDFDGSYPLPKKSIRFDQMNHFPVRVIKTRAMFCQREGCGRETTTFRCLKCNIFLCIGTRKMSNCFYLFHTKTCPENQQSESDNDDDAPVEPEPDLQIVEFNDPLNVGQERQKPSTMNKTNMVLPEGVSQPFVLIPKLDLNMANTADLENNDLLILPPSPSSTMNESTDKVPVRGRNGRTIKPKIDPNFKYLPAGAKKHALNFGIASAESKNSSTSLLKPITAKLKKTLKPNAVKIQQGQRNYLLEPSSIKIEGGGSTMAQQSRPIPKPMGGIRKRKLKPIKDVSAAYLKIRKEKQKQEKQKQQQLQNKPIILKSQSIVQPETSEPTQVILSQPAQLVHHAPLNNYQYQRARPTMVVSQRQQYQQPQREQRLVTSMYAIQQIDRAPSPESILPDDIPTIIHNQFQTENFIGGGINQSTIVSFQQRDDGIKEESIEICDNEIDSSFTLTADSSSDSTTPSSPVAVRTQETLERHQRLEIEYLKQRLRTCLSKENLTTSGDHECNRFERQFLTKRLNELQAFDDDIVL